MSSLSQRARSALVTVVTGASLATTLMAGVVPAATAAAANAKAIYIVQMADLPAAGYTGGIAGYAATKPVPGTKLATSSDTVKAYRQLLKSRHDATVSKVAGAQKLYDYSASFNGFAAQMTAEQAAALAKSAGVLTVSKNEIRQADTVSTPTFLGLDAPGGIWEQAGGPKNAGKGQSLIIGDIDSGAWPESASFRPLDHPAVLQGWTGQCTVGDHWAASNCNNKLIGARWYNAGLGGDDGARSLNATEYMSARDHHGHGTHTASTAAGDYNTDVVINGNSLGLASGMAPAARIAIYKALWGPTASGSASGSTADLVAAIDDAVSDGVDVINYSVSGSLTSDADPVEIAFLFAADANVFVSASAGNSGPGASTVAHNSPWEMTVAAGTHDRAFRASVTLGNGATYEGAGIGAAVPSSPIILSTAAGLAGAGATGVARCFSTTWDSAHPEGFLDPAKVAGKIVVCDRGTNDRIDKSRAVQQAGGVGMVLANVSPNSLNADFHFVPTVHVDNVMGAAIKAYVSGTTNPTASLSAGHKVTDAKAPLVASFSSRGPELAAGGDLLKPDIMAPGVDVLAAVSPDNHSGRNFDFDSGTSMSAPHISGIALLLKQLHPSWTPMMVKSALQTTASRIDNKGAAIGTDSGGSAGALDYGSGQVNANPAVDPGLVYDSGFNDWVRFLCGSGQLSASGSTCTSFGSIDPSNLNTANIAIGDLVGSQTVTRTVKNVGAGGNYTVSVQAPAGVNVSVSPSTLNIKAGASASYSVTFTRTSAAFGSFSLGGLEWSDGKHHVHSQLAIRPVAISAPATVSGSGTSGSTPYTIKSGYTGTLTTSVAGLVAATPAARTLDKSDAGGFSSATPTESSHTFKTTVAIPAGTTLARFSTFDSDYPAGTDIDVFVYSGGTLVAQSSGASAEEEVNLTNPAAGNYDVYVDLFALASGQTSQAVTEYSWALGSASAGNLTASPASQPVTVGATAPVTISWSGLTSGSRYLGRVLYGDGTTTIGSSIVRVNG